MIHDPPVGLQLYTLREVCSENLRPALRIAADAGYRHLEWFGGFWGLDPADLRRILDDLELTLIAAHVALEELETDLSRLADGYETLGCTTLVCPWLSEERRQHPTAFIEVGRILNRIGYRLKTRGFRLAYHNHDFELRARSEAGAPIDGIQQILAQASQNALGIELDVFWLAYSGIDPATYIRAIGERVRLVHLKDGHLDRPSFTSLGDGDVDIVGAVIAGLEVGVDAFIVEQDRCDGDAGAAIARSLDYLDRHLGDLLSPCDTADA